MFFLEIDLKFLLVLFPEFELEVFVHIFLGIQVFFMFFPKTN